MPLFTEGNAYFNLQIFQQPSFSLQNPDTFNAVFPWNQVTVSRQEQSGKSRQSTKLLQEKVCSSQMLESLLNLFVFELFFWFLIILTLHFFPY
jgi:hypothetical protein